MAKVSSGNSDQEVKTDSKTHSAEAEWSIAVSADLRSAWHKLKTTRDQADFVNAVRDAMFLASHRKCRWVLWNRVPTALEGVTLQQLSISSLLNGGRRELDYRCFRECPLDMIKAEDIDVLCYTYEFQRKETTESADDAWKRILEDLDRLVPVTHPFRQLVYVIGAPDMPLNVYPYGKRNLDTLPTASGHFGTSCFCMS